MKTLAKIDWLKSLQRTVFGIVLLVALGISWYSLMTLATDFFGLPVWLSAVVSVAMDGAGIYAALLASAYAKTRHSGMVPRLATMGFVLLSAWLNWNHAQMSGLNFAGCVFYAAPSLMAGLLFELMLTFENKTELEKRGRIPEALPVLGKIAWLRYPRDAFKSISKIVKHRLDQQTDREIGQTSQTDTTIDKTDTSDVVSEPQTDKKTRKTKKTDIPEWMPSDPTMSVNKLSKVCYDNGVKGIDEVLKLANKVKNVEVSRASVQKGLNRAKNEAASTGGYL